MNRRLLIAGAIALVVGVMSQLSHASDPAPPGTGLWLTTGNAPNPSVAADRDEVTPGGFGAHSPGTLTVSNVYVGGVKKTKGTDYELDGNGTSEVKIRFLPGKEPPAGAKVDADGTCSNSNHSPYEGTNTFS